MKIEQDFGALHKFTYYPEHVRPKMDELRGLIVEAAEELGTIDRLDETLKWGQPSYLAKKGSTVRIDWKEKQPEKVSVFFKCTSKIVPTIKEV